MNVMRKLKDDKIEVDPRKFTLTITRDQEHKLMEEARRWELEEIEMLQFILRWGFEMYFRG